MGTTWSFLKNPSYSAPSDLIVSISSSLSDGYCSNELLNAAM